MRPTILALILISIAGCSQEPVQTAQGNPPALVLGEFEDDYEIRYSISRDEWFQHPRARYRIVRWNVEAQYAIAQNDAGNAEDGGLWTRIDWVALPDMEPFTWAFCLSAFKAATADEAEATTTARGDEPRTGCNGFPFSRMRPFVD